MTESYAKLKTEEERDRALLEQKVSQYIRLTRQAAEVAAEIESIKGWFEARGLHDLNATKIKTVDYWSDAGKVEVGRSEKVIPISLTMLQPVFGAAFEDLVKEKTSLDMTAPCKKILADIALGNYIDTPLEEIILQVSQDPKTAETLRKRIRGNFKRDKAALISVAGMSEQDAEYYAYMAAEAVAYERFAQLLEAGGYTGTFAAARDIVRAAVIVEEGVKVTPDSRE